MLSSNILSLFSVAVDDCIVFVDYDLTEFFFFFHSGRSGDDSNSPESLDSTGFSALKRGGSPVAAEELSVDDESSRAQQLKVVAYTSRSHDLKLKVIFCPCFALVLKRSQLR